MIASGIQTKSVYVKGSQSFGLTYETHTNSHYAAYTLRL